MEFDNILLLQTYVIKKNITKNSFLENFLELEKNSC